MMHSKNELVEGNFVYNFYYTIISSLNILFALLFMFVMF